MVFDLLRTIPSRALVGDYSGKLDLLEIITKWLKVSVSVYGQRTKNLICVQELGPERPSKLYDRFQGECMHQDSVNRHLPSPDFMDLLGPSPDYTDLLAPSPDFTDLLAPSPDSMDLLGPSPDFMDLLE